MADAPPSMSKGEKTRILREGAVRYASLAATLGVGEDEAADAASGRLEEAEGDSLMTDPIRVESLTVRYGKTVACRDVSFSVAPGAVYALLGRNGAGKSSLVRCLLGQQKPSSGRALLFEEDSWTTRRRAMERIGVVPEEPDAPPAMSARTSSRRSAGGSIRGGTRARSPRASSASASRQRRRSASSRRARRARSCWRSRSDTPPTCSSWTIRRSASTSSRGARSPRRSWASSPTAARRSS